MKGKSQSRTWLVGVAATLMILAGLPCTAQMTLTVDTLDDVVDANDGYLSLREALEMASTYDTIDFDPTLLPGTIYLDPAIGTLFIDQDLTIAGPGPELLTIDGQCTTTQEYSVFTVGTGYMMTDAHINGLTITRGGTLVGGGVLNLAKLTMSNCVMTKCLAEVGGAIANAGEMSLDNCVMTGCTAWADGGAVLNVGVMTMTGCLLSENVASVGGAVTSAGANGVDATLTMEDCQLTDNAALYFGGALLNGIASIMSEFQGSDVSLTNCTLTGNLVLTRDPDSWLPSGMGGAICNLTLGSDVNLTLDTCELSNNSAAYGGGIGIMATSATDNSVYPPVVVPSRIVTTILDSTLTGNLAWLSPESDPKPSDGVAGGALAIISMASDTDEDVMSLTIDRCTLDDNAALGQWSVGGAIAYSGYLANASLNIKNSTVSNNSVEGTEGAMGGALVLYSWENYDATSTSLTTRISNSTLSGNSVVLTGEPTSYFAAEAGCIYNQGDLFIDNCTLADNIDVLDNPDVPPSSGIFTERNPDAVVGGALSIKNTILANDPSGRNINSNLAEVTSHGYNISSDDSSLFLDEPTDMNNTDPMLDLLADNGGPTKTHTLMTSSPAINAASSTDIAGNPVVLDQRGIVRPQGTANDIGAVEMEMAHATSLEISPATVDRQRRTTVVTIQIHNGQSETALNNMLTTATLGGIQCVERLPMRLGTIVSGNTKERQLTFKDVPLGEVTLVIEGTSSLGDFSSTQTLELMP